MIEILELPGMRIVTLAQLKQHLRVEFTDDDELIEAYNEAAESRLDGPTGITGRAFRPQRLRLSLPGFCARICLPFPPLISVDRMSYLDSNGDELEFAQAGNWRVIGIGAPGGGMIVREEGVEWPSLQATADPDLVRIDFTAGYYSAVSPEDDRVPAAIKAAIKLMVADWYEFRPSTVIGTSAAPTPHGVENLIAPLRVAGAYVG